MTVTPWLSSWLPMSADCDAASVLTRLLIWVQRDLGVVDADVEAQALGAAQFGAHAGGGDERLRRHAVVEHAGAADAVGVDDRHLRDVPAAGGGDQRRLVARRPAADDHDARYHGFNLLAPARRPACRNRPDVGRRNAMRLSFSRADLRRLRVEHASRADAAAGTALPDGRHGVAARLAADVRRRGHRLGRRAGHRRRGSRRRRSSWCSTT